MVRSGCSEPPLESSLAELNSSSSYHISSLTLPLKLETDSMINLVGTPPSSSDLMLTAPLNHHCTEEIPQLTLQALFTRSSLSSFLLPSLSAVSTHDQLAMALRNQVIELRGSSGSSLESQPQA
ncbi:unnamed protein product [Brassica rapa]|uniref:Uncharacterized protein n=1 Tax=Brassica campestris TaxID=3711 RepID=A0A8D9D7E7_BRACM|nr:unnamed protein product [Brassica rapa]